MRKIYVALLHAPMLDRKGEEVVTAVTNLDLHDIARSCRTFGISKYFVVNPEPEQEKVVGAILAHWHAEVSKAYHPARAKALELIQFARTFSEAQNEIMRDAYEGQNPPPAGLKPFVAMPDARRLEGKVWGYGDLRGSLSRGKLSELDDGTQPLVLVFGTGWGLAPRFFSEVDCILAPIESEVATHYNHLSVRAAAAIVLDRLFGKV